MASWNETDQMLEFTRPDGQTVKIAKTPTFMAPGGQYEKLKAEYDQSVATSNAPKPSPFDSFGGAMDPNAMMDQQATASMPALPPPPPAPVTAPTPSANAEGVPSAAAPQAIPSPSPAYGMEQQDTTTTVYEGLGGKGKQLLNQAAEKQREAAALTYDAEIAKNRAQVDAAQAISAQSQQFLDAERARQAEIDKRAAEWDARVEEATRKYQSASLDSGRLWKNAGTGSKIAAGVGLMLGALGQALTGKENSALKVINEAIDRDIDEQKVNMDKMGKEASSMRGAYADFLRATGDERAARAAMHSMALENIKVQMNAKLATAEDPKIAANLQSALAGIDAEIAKNQGTVKSTKTSQTAIAPTKAGAAPAAQFDQNVNDTLQPLVRTISGFKSVINTFKDPEVREEVGVINSYVNRLKNKFGMAVNPKWIAADTQAGQVQRTLLKQMSGSGVSEGERNLYRDVMSRVDQDPDNAVAIAEEFLKEKEAEYEDVRRGHLGRYGGRNPALEATYPPLKKDSDYGYKPQ